MATGCPAAQSTRQGPTLDRTPLRHRATQTGTTQAHRGASRAHLREAGGDGRPSEHARRCGEAVPTAQTAPAGNRSFPSRRRDSETASPQDALHLRRAPRPGLQPWARRRGCGPQESTRLRAHRGASLGDAAPRSSPSPPGPGGRVYLGDTGQCLSSGTPGQATAERTERLVTDSVGGRPRPPCPRSWLCAGRPNGRAVRGRGHHG